MSACFVYVRPPLQYYIRRASRILLPRCVLQSRAMSDLCLRRVLKSMPRVCLHAPCMFVLRFSNSTYDMYTLINTP